MIPKVGKRVFIRCAEASVLVVLILAALYVTMGRILIGSAENYRGEVQSFLATRLDAPVTIQKLDGTWSYLDPGLIVHGLVIGPQNEPALALTRVSFRLKSISSLFEWNPVISELEVAGLRVTVEQDAAGNWHVSGLPSQSGAELDFDLLMDSVPHLNLLSLKDIEVNLLARQSRYQLRSESDEPFELVSSEGVKTLSLPLVVERVDRETGDVSVDAMQLIGRYRGDARERGEFSTELYFQLPSLELTDFLPPLLYEGLRISQVRARGQFWFGYEDGRFTLTGMPTVSDIELKSQDRALTVIKDMSTEFRLSGTGLNDSYLQVARLSAMAGSRELDLENASVTFASENQIVARISELNLGLIGNVLTDVGHGLGFIDDRALKALESMDPRGLLQEILITANTQGAVDGLKLTGRLSDASIKAYRGTPAIDNVEGIVSIEPRKGYIDVHNESTTLEFARMFDQPWSFDSAQGRFNYSYERGYLQVTSGLLEAVTGDLQARGKLQLNLRHNRLHQNWGLAVGIVNGDLTDAPRYFPNVVPEGARQWLAGALSEGKLTEAGLLFHGSLHPDAPKIEKLHDLYFKVEDSILDYDPAWPPVEDLAGTVYVGTDGVHSEGAKGHIYDSLLSNGVVHIPIGRDGKADVIKINAELHGPLSDGIRLFQESPLADITGHAVQDWTGTGRMEGILALEIPIGNRFGENILSNVSVSFRENDIFMPRYDLEVLEVEGVAGYTSEDGLFSDNLRGTIFGEPVSGSINSLIDNDGGEVIIDISGDVDIADLYSWSQQILLTRASGMMNYEAEVHVPFGSRRHERSYVEATSNLEGVEIDMPRPLAKKSSDEMPMVYRQYFLEPGHQVEFDVGNKVNGILKLVDNVVQGGHIRFGADELGSVTFDDLKVSGLLEYVDYNQWQEFITYIEDNSAVSLASELAGRLDSIDIDVGVLDVFGMQLEDLHSLITRDQSSWDVQLKNENLTGRVTIPDNDKEPVGVELAYLRFNEDRADTKDPLAGVAVDQLVPVDFSTEELSVGEENYGSWRFRLRPEADGAVLKDLTANVKGSRIIESSEVHWELGNEPVSRFKGTIVTDDLADALEQWGFASSIKGKDFTFVADVKWPGSPAMISVDSIMGEISLREGEGRFVQAEAAGALNLLGIFDFASLARRFRFDFSDIVDEGYSFRKIKGVARFNQGMVDIVDPIVIEGASSTVKVGGSLDLDTRELNNEMIVTLPVNRNLPWYAAYSAIVTGPLVGAGVFLAQKIFESQIDQISSAKYEVTGTIDEPKVKFVSIFTDEMREVKLDELGSRKIDPEEPDTESEVETE